MNKSMMKAMLLQRGHYWINREEDTGSDQPYRTMAMDAFLENCSDQDFDTVIDRIKTTPYVLTLTNYKPDEFIAMLKDMRLKKTILGGEHTSFQYWLK